MAGLCERDHPAPQAVYDLTVSGLHTFYAVAGGTPVLIHNCDDLVADAQKFPGQAHILDEHVNPTQSEALRLAVRKGEKNSVFVDFQTAQQVVDYALANKAGEITTWLRGNAQQKTLRGTFGARNPLGFVAHPDGRTITQASNQYVIILKRAPGHRFGYYVFTGYPV